MKYIPINKQNRQQVTNFIAERWLSTDMIIRGTRIDMTKVDGIGVWDKARLVGLLTYTIRGETCEIISLDSLTAGKGIGTNLINQSIQIANKNKCRKIIVVTTNDNIEAIRFYQKRGFDMARFYANALDVSRMMKPEIPLKGENGIPMRHEIEFEMNLAN